MPNFFCETQDAATYLVYRVQNSDELDSLTLEMMTHNAIPGFAAASFVQTETAKYIRYDISAKISAVKLFGGVVTKKKLLGVLAGIVDAMLVAEEYLIDSRNLLLDLEYIFSDVDTCETVLICLPVMNPEDKNHDVGMFFTEIVLSTQLDDTENCEYVKIILNYLNHQHLLSLSDFKVLLSQLAENEELVYGKSVEYHNLTAFPACQESEDRERRKKLEKESLKSFLYEIECFESRICELNSLCCDSLIDNYYRYAICNTIKKVELSKVQFSAISPTCFIKGEYSMIDIFMYEESYRNVLDELISGAEYAVRETNSGAYNVEDNAKIRIILSSQDIEIENNEDYAIWSGKYLRFSYPVCIPKNYKGKQVRFNASVYINDIIASQIRFIAKVSRIRLIAKRTASKKKKQKVTRRDIMSAFVSYASQDRSSVAMVIQGIKKVRPDLDLFFDVDSLRSGENWEEVIEKEIVKRDIFYLCWSQAACQSKWVEKEWRYALSQKGLDFIDPIAIDPPSVCPPPEELRKKHFNDRMLYYID